ncbi:MAG: SDR family NAD(P)-dependent oxidoreductase [Chloroflexota bacterium]
MKTGKLAVVTGGTGGLGSRIVHELCAQGMNVVVNHVRDGARVDVRVDLPGSVLHVRADVSRANEVEEMAGRVSRLGGPVSVLINNAAITRDALLVRQNESDWDRVLQVNLKGPFNCIRAFAPLMEAGGHIVNVSSYSGLKGKRGQAAYSASKAALVGLTKTAARELGIGGILVNAVLPGYLGTSMGIRAKEAMEQAMEESVLKSLSDIEETARFIAYLVSTERITGQVFVLDSRVM